MINNWAILWADLSTLQGDMPGTNQINQMKYEVFRMLDHMLGYVPFMNWNICPTANYLLDVPLASLPTTKFTMKTTSVAWLMYSDEPPIPNGLREVSIYKCFIPLAHLWAWCFWERRKVNIMSRDNGNILALSHRLIENWCPFKSYFL